MQAEQYIEQYIHIGGGVRGWAAKRDLIRGAGGQHSGFLSKISFGFLSKVSFDFFWRKMVSWPNLLRKAGFFAGFLWIYFFLESSMISCKTFLYLLGGQNRNLCYTLRRTGFCPRSIWICLVRGPSEGLIQSW